MGGEAGRMGGKRAKRAKCPQTIKVIAREGWKIFPPFFSNLSWTIPREGFTVFSGKGVARAF